MAKYTKDNIRLSASSISTFRQCPRKWYFKYVEDQKEPAGLAAIMGSYVHEVLEFALAESPGKRTFEKAVEISKAKIQDKAQSGNTYAHDLTINSEDNVTEQDLIEQAWSTLEKLWKWEDPNELDIIANEMRLEVEIEDFKFLGLVDRVDQTSDGIAIVDYKTGKLGKPEYLPTKLMQIFLYAMAYEEQQKQMPSIGKLIYLNEGIVHVGLGPEKVKAARQYLLRNGKKMRKAFDEGFNPKTGPLCCWCPFIDQCPEGIDEFKWRSRSGKVRLDAPAFWTVGNTVTEDDLARMYIPKDDLAPDPHS